jgi:single-strand DNA-binding protein
MNKVILIGRLVKNPETKFTQSNMQICKFSMATSKKIKGEEQTEWHNIVCFSKTAEIAEKFLSKGSLVCIEGSINTSVYEKDGEKKYSTQIVCDRLEMLGGKSDQKNEPSVNVDIEKIDDDLPF